MCSFNEMDGINIMSVIYYCSMKDGILTMSYTQKSFGTNIYVSNMADLWIYVTELTFLLTDFQNTTQKEIFVRLLCKMLNIHEYKT